MSAFNESNLYIRQSTSLYLEKEYYSYNQVFKAIRADLFPKVKYRLTSRTITILNILLIYEFLSTWIR